MPLTIVMYHYVRDLARSRYPAIKARDRDSFVRQLDYLQANHTVVTAEQVIAASKGLERLPDDAAWLTFDDGYIDHFTVVFPLLHERGWQGSFFPPVGAIKHGELLDVNQIHFVLAASYDHQAVIDEIRSFIEEYRTELSLRAVSSYWEEFATPSRLDPADVVFIKRIVQHGLPEAARKDLAARLFAKFVSIDPSAFAAELYMSPEQLRTLISCGMHVGSHGSRHYWLDRLEPPRQAEEVDASLVFLEELGAPVKDWVMCYPYGAHNDSLLNCLRSRRCAIGLTTRQACADLSTDDPLKLPRLDTNALAH
jgi:peptidoglycan/xylan/chitin deacetylase (PgdA/CDA1 family)